MVCGRFYQCTLLRTRHGIRLIKVFLFRISITTQSRTISAKEVFVVLIQLALVVNLSNKIK